MSKNYILIIEYDTQGTIATLINQKGDQFAQGSHNISHHYPQKGWVEFNPLESIYSVRAAINNMFQKTKIPPNAIIAIGITTPNTGALIWDRETGLPLYNGISLSCNRVEQDKQTLLHSQINTYIKEKTGSSLESSSPVFYWKWIINSINEAKQAMKKGTAQVGTLDTWLIYNLTGRKEHLTDYTHAFKTLMFDLKELTWDPMLMQEFSLTEKALPIVTQSSHIFGKTEGFLSLPDHIPILGVSICSSAELLGSNGLRFQESNLSFNHNGQFTMNTGTQLHPSIEEEISPVVLSFPKEVRYGLAGQVLFPNNITPFLGHFPAITQPDQAQALMEETPDSQGVFIISKKDQNNTPSTSIIGLKDSSTQSHIIRAYFESLVFNSRYFLDQFQNKVGLYPKELKISGSFAKYDFLLQLQANILQIPIKKMKESKSKLIGMSYLVGVMSGFFQNESELLRIVKIEKQFIPSMDPISSQLLYSQWLECQKKTGIEG